MPVKELRMVFWWAFWQPCWKQMCRETARVFQKDGNMLSIPTPFDKQREYKTIGV